MCYLEVSPFRIKYKNPDVFNQNPEPVASPVPSFSMDIPLFAKVACLSTRQQQGPGDGRLPHQDRQLQLRNSQIQGHHRPGMSLPCWEPPPDTYWELLRVLHTTSP